MNCALFGSSLRSCICAVGINFPTGSCLYRNDNLVHKFLMHDAETEFDGGILATETNVVRLNILRILMPA